MFREETCANMPLQTLLPENSMFLSLWAQTTSPGFGFFEMSTKSLMFSFRPLRGHTIPKGYVGKDSEFPTYVCQDGNFHTLGRKSAYIGGSSDEHNRKRAL